MGSLFIAELRAQAYAEGMSQLQLCFKYMKMGYSPAQIAAALGEDLDEIQDAINAAQEMISM